MEEEEWKQTKAEVMKQAEGRMDWADNGMNYGPCRISVEDFSQDQKAELMRDLRQYFIEVSRPRRFSEIMWFAEKYGIEYPTKTEDMAACGEGQINDVGRLGFMAIGNESYSRSIRKQIEGAIDKMREGNVPEDGIREIVNKAFENYKAERDGFRAEGDSAAQLFDRVIEVAERVMAPYMKK